MRRLGVVFVLAVLGVLGWGAPASAHATLVGTTPTDGSHLDRGPFEVTFTLNEAVSIVQGSPQVIDAAGERHPVERSGLSADRTVVTVRLTAPLPDGSFLATARLLSPDTHVVSVSAAFTVGAAGQLLTAREKDETGDRIASYAAKLLVYLGAVLFAGVLLTTARLWPGLPARRIVRAGGLLLAAGLAGRLVIEAAHRAGGVTRISGDTVGGLFTVNPGFGISAVVALVATVAYLALPLRQPRIVAAAVVAAVAFGGHGADPILFRLPLALTLLHVYAVLAWLGGVVVIAGPLRHTAPPAAWHRYALAHAAGAAVTGAALGLLRVPAPAALAGTAYGLTLIVKVALVGAAVVAAGLAYRRITRFRATVGVELLLLVGVLGATGVLSSVAPARVSYDPPVRTTVDFGDGAMLAVTIPSTRRGPQRLIVESATGPSPAVDLSSRDANVARLPVRFDAGERVGGGLRWSSRDLVVPVTGTWRVTVTFRTPAGPRVASFHYDVR